MEDSSIKPADRLNDFANRARHFRYLIAEFPEAVTLISFLLVFLFFSAAAANFLSMYALSNILTLASVNGIIVLGTATLIIAGEFDLSVGSNLAVASFVFALSMNEGISPLPAMLLALLSSTLLGLINGLIVVTTNIPSFIATLGTLLAYRGIARIIGSGDFAYFTGEKTTLFVLLNSPLGFLNRLSAPEGNFRTSIIWFFGMAVMMSAILLPTRFGNWLYATGGNSGAALAQGVDFKRVKLVAFMLSGFFAGLGGVVQFAQRASVDPLRGYGLELVVIAAAVIGGVRLSGGYGTVAGASVGILLLSMLEQGLALMGLPIQIFRIAVGMIIILAVISNTYIQGE